MKVSNLYINLLSLFGIFTPVWSQTDFWERTNSPADPIFALHIAPDTTIFAGSNSAFGVRDILLRSIDGSNTWEEKTTGIEGLGIESIVVGPRGIIWVGTIARGLFRSEDNGNTWTSAGIPQNDIPAVVWDIAFNSQEHIFLSGHGSSNLLRSTDFGTSWQRIDNNFGDDLFDAHSISLDENDNLYTGTNLGLFTSLDNGNSWLPLEIIDEVMPTLVSGAGNIFAGTNSTLFRSTDNGATFQPASLGIDSVYVNAFLQNMEGSIFLGSRGFGILRSNDEGATWQPLTDGLSDLTVLSLAEGPNGFLYAGTGTGVYRSRETTITSVSGPDNTQPERFSLLQNFPNPFNPTTTISFSLPENTIVELSIYNLVGQRVRELFFGHLNVGSHQFVWDGLNNQGFAVPSGVYLYELQAESLTQSRKMLLLK